MLAGRLTGTVDGCPVVIEANDAGLLVTAASFRAARSMARLGNALFPSLVALRHAGVPLRFAVAGFVAVNVLPSPSILARFFVPELARLR